MQKEIYSGIDWNFYNARDFQAFMKQQSEAELAYEHTALPGQFMVYNWQDATLVYKPTGFSKGYASTTTCQVTITGPETTIDDLEQRIKQAQEQAA